MTEEVHLGEHDPTLLLLSREMRSEDKIWAWRASYNPHFLLPLSAEEIDLMAPNHRVLTHEPSKDRESEPRAQQGQGIHGDGMAA